MNHLREREVEWAAQTVTFGEILDSFAEYCRATDDLGVVEQAPTSLSARWRDREVGTIELGDDVPGREEPTLLLTELADGLVSRLLDDAALRSRLAVYDLDRLEKANAVRSSLFVHFEWFLRDEYGVKVVASEAFTRGLVDRGIISLGFG